MTIWRCSTCGTSDSRLFRLKGSCGATPKRLKLWPSRKGSCGFDSLGLRMHWLCPEINHQQEIQGEASQIELSFWCRDQPGFVRMKPQRLQNTKSSVRLAPQCEHLITNQPKQFASTLCFQNLRLVAGFERRNRSPLIDFDSFLCGNDLCGVSSISLQTSIRRSKGAGRLHPPLATRRIRTWACTSRSRNQSAGRQRRRCVDSFEYGSYRHLQKTR